MSGPTSDISLKSLRRILLDASVAHTVEAQVQSLVDDVCEVMNVGACSLYQRDGDWLRAVANRGFNQTAVASLRLVVGEGLIGKIAANRVPVNVADATGEEGFRYFPESGEERYPAFLGVPIVHLGEVQGVLAVQDSSGRVFSGDEESFLVTIAAQLAPVLLRYSHDVDGGGQREYKGIAAAPGKAIGTVRLVLSEQTLRYIDEPGFADVDEELQVLGKALDEALADLDRAKRQFGDSVSAEVLELFEVHRLLLANEQIIAGAERRIREGLSAFSAIREIVDEYVKAFEAIQDDYLRARAEDVRSVGDQLLGRIVGAAAPQPVPGEKTVLLGNTVSIADMGAFAVSDLAGIVCFAGSSLSHTAVVARSLGIPAVFSTGPIDHIDVGLEAIVDGDLGAVTLSPTEATLDAYRRLIRGLDRFHRELLADSKLPALSTEGVRIELLANTGLLADASPGKDYGAEGIGLFRSEIPFLSGTAFPGEGEQFETYRRLLEMYHPGPVTMRTLDIGGDKPLPYMPIDEANPALGWRGVRFSLDNPAVLLSQLRAMLRANQGLDNLRVMLPMVSRIDEVVRVRQVLEELARDLGFTGALPPLGIMVEIPGVVTLLPHLTGLIDFVSVGTNDLTQYLLAVDRSNARVSMLYDSLHPAVLETLDTILRRASAIKVSVSVCGEIAADPAAAMLLIGMGFRSLSMTAYSLPRVKAVIRRLSVVRAEQVAAAACAMDSAESVHNLVDEQMQEMGLGEFLRT